jgi:predicted alpha/beta hydrolase family esterase
MKKSNLFIIHGAFGSPNENWFPWLKNEIEKSGIEVFVPSFPTPEGQSLVSWNKVFKPYEKHLTEKTILVGHSLGPAFILNLLERVKTNVAASFLVSPFTGLINLPEFDTINFSLTDRNFDWEKIKSHCKDFYVYHSDNDPYVHQSKSALVAEKVEAKKYEIIKGGGHLNESSGFSEFPLLLEDIKKQLLKND